MVKGLDRMGVRSIDIDLLYVDGFNMSLYSGNVW